MNFRKTTAPSLQSSESPKRFDFKGLYRMKKETLKRKYISPFTVVAAAICVLLTAFLLVCMVEHNEVTIEKTKKNKEYEQLVSQGELLEVEIERKYSLGNVEKIATEQLGMVKLQPYQIHTVNLAEGDNVEIAVESKDSTFVDGFVQSFNILLEYLN